jgi:glycosyltransferase 2 family protein
MTIARRTILLQIAISVTALAAVAWWASRQHVPSLPDSADALSGLFGAVGLYVLTTFARGERWHRVLLLVDGRSSRPDAYSLTAVGYMGNNTLPARAGDVLKSVITARRTGLTTPEVFGAAVAERVLDAVALGAMFLVLGGFVLTDAGIPAARAVVLLLVGLGLLACAALAVPRVRRDHPRIQRAVDFAVALLRPSRALLSARGAQLLLGTALIWVLEATVYATVAGAVGLPLHGLDALYLVALTNLVALIPAAPGYVGTFDAAVLFGVRALTGTASGTTYVVALRLVLFVPITLAGLLLLVVRHGGLDTLRALRGGFSPAAAPRP